MAIREIISFSKDCLTGEISTEKKVKKDNGIKGKVLVELFDANNEKKIRETYTENIIPDVIFKDIFARFFAGDVMGIGNTNHDNTKDLFSHIYLTDSTKPELKTAERVLGNVIGYAHRDNTYSGDATDRGTINTAETKMEVENNRIRVNFVFDFPTHAANGEFESIFWGEAPTRKNAFYSGPSIFGRNYTGDGHILVYNDDDNKHIYWSLRYLIDESASKHTIYTDYHKGFTLFDATHFSVDSNLIKFPEDLKGHQVMIPFDYNIDGFVNWNQATTLLNEDGEAIESLTKAIPVLKEDGDVDYYVGFYRWSGLLIIYKWSSVGVLQSKVSIDDYAIEFQDEYGADFNYRDITIDPVFWGGKIEIMGYNSRTDPNTDETIYSSRLIRLNLDGTKHSELDLKPRTGNAHWFISNGMDGGNIERRCHVSSLSGRSKNRLYIYYNGVNGGNSFYQVITADGNLLEAYRDQWDFNASNFKLFNKIGTDKWISQYKNHSTHGTNRYYFGIYYGATSMPCGAHTKLVNPVQKTDANTMKVQYMFEIDLVDYLNDLY
ncbi:hypothetical protein GGQ84_002761 [Desulfitispora alkaliphila]|uniref:hypothetical protein n=1 Tax=Desulfitispora alkaliphila TaxID=622674 RepID=UPI003D209C24